MYYKTVIGLEIHIELNTKSKMFCSCLNDSDERRANFNICPICTAQPGTLPVINQEAINKVIKTGLALNCKIPEYSKFDRKNYFYPDLPKGYQISQYDKPLCLEGFLEIRTSPRENLDSSPHSEIGGKKVRIRRVHLEEDTGRLIHPAGEDYSLVDFNRAGVPLMELVTEPDIDSAKEAKSFAEELHRIFHYLNISDADMEKGEMRVEVNLSLSKKKGELGTKVEIKNLNSFRSVERSIDYEIKRQTEALDKGEKIVQETRGWDDSKSKTVSQREKEEAHDYRYFPEPDLPLLHFKREDIDKIRAEIPELPQQKRERFKKEFGLEEEFIEIFVRGKDLGEYFEKVVSEFESGLPRKKILGLVKLASNYLITDLQGLLKGDSVKSTKFLITPENFAEFISLVYEGNISSKIAKMVLEEMFRTGGDPSDIIRDKGLAQINDESEIEKVIEEVVSKNPKIVEDFGKGKEGVLQYLVGQVMAQTKGKANPQAVNKLLRRTLTNSK